MLGAARPGVGAAAEPGEQGEGVAAVAEPARVVPDIAGDGFGREVDAGQEPGGQAWGELVAVGGDVDQDQPGGARGDPGHRAALAAPPGGDAAGAGGRGAHAVAPAARGQARAGVREVSGNAVLGAAGRAVGEGPFADRR